MPANDEKMSPPTFAVLPLWDEGGSLAVAARRTRSLPQLHGERHHY